MWRSVKLDMMVLWLILQAIRLAHFGMVLALISVAVSFIVCLTLITIYRSGLNSKLLLYDYKILVINLSWMMSVTLTMLWVTLLFIVEKQLISTVQYQTGSFNWMVCRRQNVSFILCYCVHSYFIVLIHSTGSILTLWLKSRNLCYQREYYQYCSVLDCVTQCSQSAAHLYEQFLQVPSNRLGFSHWGPYTVSRGGCLELYGVVLVGFKSDLNHQLVSSSVLTLLVRSMVCKNRPWNDL